MLTKNQQKYYSALLQKKSRKNEHKFLVEGKKLIEEALNFHFVCEVIFVTKTFYENNRKYVDSLSHSNIRIEILKLSEFVKLSDTKTSQEINSVFLEKEKNNFFPISEHIVVALENISDPGNLGTIFRNCDWFGVKNVLLSNDCAEVYNPKVIRASAGSVFHLNILEDKSFYQSLSKLKDDGYKILCADTEGENIYQQSFNNNLIIVFSNEANGPTNRLLEICDYKFTIPPKGNAESLNVASASAVILSELTK